MNIVLVIFLALVSASWGEIIEISEQKELRKFLRTHKNVLIFYQETGRSGKDWLPVLRDAATEIEGKGSIININCKSSKKLCKKMKVSPSPTSLKHYKDGKFHKDYDRTQSSKSLSRFMEDPTSEIPWDEDQTAHSVVHVETEKDLARLVTKEAKPILIMFYAPWCGYCKRLKPEFAMAATDLKQEAVLAGMDVDKPELMGIRQNFNITGFPTIFYIRQGRIMFKYGGDSTKDGIVSWMRNPQPPKEPEEEKKWADEDGAEDIHFLTADTFDAFLKKESSVLVMFYAPWCGHCKAMKPSFNEVARTMKKEGIPGALAAVDATKESSLAEKFKVKGFPTIKYFRDGEFAFEFNERTSEKLLEFMKDPKEPPPPPPPEKPWAEEESEVNHLMTDNFFPFLRKKKHVLVMFYAPWCGHCKKAKPEFTRAAEVLKEDRKVSFAAVDCTSNDELCKGEGVSGFPTFNFYNYGRRSETGYTLEREEEDFVAFMRNPDNPQPGQKRHWKDVSGAHDLVFLGSDNFDDELKGKEAFVKFYAPWCGHCKKMKPAFAELAGLVKNTLPGVIVGAIDATKDEELAARFEVKGYPTLLYVKSDGAHEKYRGARTVEDMLTYIQSKRLKEEDPKQKEEEKEEETLMQEEAERQRKREKELEEQRKKEEEKKRQKELEEQREKEAEKKRQKELEEQRRNEAEKKRQRELDEQRKKEAEKKRQKELEEQRKNEAEKKRQKELEAQRKKEAEKKRKKELEEQRKKEAEKKRKKELEEQRKKEAKKRQKELEEQRKKEAQKKRQKELEEQRRKEAEKKRQKELEEQRKKEAEKKRQKELEEQRKKEAEKKRQKELEEQRKKEAEKKRKKELEEQRKKEAEKKRQKELEEQRKKEAEKKRKKELEEQRKKEAEKKRQKELEEQRKKEAEKRKKELEEQRKKEAEKKRQKELEEQRKKEAEKSLKDSSSAKDTKKDSHSHGKKEKQEL